MDALLEIQIERECGRLPLLFARYADNGDHAALANLFAEDCEFARPFQPDHIQLYRRAIEVESVAIRGDDLLAQRLAQGREGLAKIVAGLRLAHSAPQQPGQVIA